MYVNKNKLPISDQDHISNDGNYVTTQLDDSNSDAKTTDTTQTEDHKTNPTASTQTEDNKNNTTGTNTTAIDAHKSDGENLDIIIPVLTSFSKNISGKNMLCISFSFSLSFSLSISLSLTLSLPAGHLRQTRLGGVGRVLGASPPEPPSISNMIP